MKNTTASAKAMNGRKNDSRRTTGKNAKANVSKDSKKEIGMPAGKYPTDGIFVDITPIVGTGPKGPVACPDFENGYERLLRDMKEEHELAEYNAAFRNAVYEESDRIIGFAEDSDVSHPVIMAALMDAAVFYYMDTEYNDEPNDIGFLRAMFEDSVKDYLDAYCESLAEEKCQCPCCREARGEFDE